MVFNIEKNLKKTSKIIDINFQNVLSKKPYIPDRLLNAIKYSTCGVGKKIRAFLLIESALVCSGLNRSKIFNKACKIATAVELIHSYSLIHDDLPSMDNSDLRRGKESSHKAFDEATAILAGDALQSLAFEILSDPKLINNCKISLQLCRLLAKSIGCEGMVAGQMLDLVSENRFENKKKNENDIYLIQKLKTGELINFSVVAGATIGGANKKQKTELSNFAEKLGVAFQIKDDLLDIESNETKLGKPVHTDKKSGKFNFVNLLGYNKSKRKVNVLISKAKKHLDGFKDNNKLLEFADFVEKREK